MRQPELWGVVVDDGAWLLVSLVAIAGLYAIDVADRRNAGDWDDERHHNAEGGLLRPLSTADVRRLLRVIGSFRGADSDVALECLAPLQTLRFRY